MVVPDVAGTSPVVVLVEPQLAENIGMVARAMANFGLSDLRLVAPRDGWPANGRPPKGARQAASGAVHVLDRARIVGSTREAVADLNLVFATTARERDQMKRVLGPEPAMRQARAAARDGQRVGILFGRERTGLENDEVALADAIVTFPVDPAFASLNLAQAVLLVAYEWSRGGESHDGAAAPAAPFERGLRSPPAPRGMLASFLDYVEGALDGVGFYPAEKKSVMSRNMRDMVLRMHPTEQDVRTLRGAVRALVEGRRVRKP